MRTNFTRYLLWICGMVSALTGAWSAAAEEDPFAPFRQRIEEAIVKQSLPSIAVAVARDGQILWEQGFGWADRENRRRATEHTLYSLASISKPITATGLMVLVEQNKIALDRPIDDYLGEAKIRARVGSAADATVRRVANHTSGLPLHYQFYYHNEAFRPPSRDETIRRYANLVTAPDERFQYSNLGYGLLDYIIARASGKSYTDFMREEVFLPLGLTHMSVDVGPGLEAHQAIRYTGGGEPIPFYEFDHPGGSAVYASAHDLVRFGMFHCKAHLADQQAILTDAAIDAMQEPTGHLGGERHYGVGWFLDQTPGGHRVVEHTGGMPGVSTILSLVPSERLVVVVLANTNTSLPASIAQRIVRQLLPPREESPEEKPQQKPGSDEAQPDAGFPATLVGRWQGTVVTHRAELPLVVDVRAADDVRLRLGDQLETLLSSASFRDGYLRGRFAGDIGSEDTRGAPYQLHLELKLRGEGDTRRLGGTVQATSLGRAGSISHWCELKPEAAQP